MERSATKTDSARFAAGQLPAQRGGFLEKYASIAAVRTDVGGALAGDTEQRLELTDRLRRAGANVVGPGEREGDCAAHVAHGVGEADFARLSGADFVGREQEARRGTVTDQRHEPRNGPPRGRDAQAHLLEREARPRVDDAEITSDRELGATAERDADDGREDGDLELADFSTDFPTFIAKRLGSGAGGDRAKLLEITPGREGVAAAGQDDGPKSRVLGRIVQGAVQRVHDRGIERVLRGRAVDRPDRDRAVTLRAQHANDRWRRRWQDGGGGNGARAR